MITKKMDDGLFELFKILPYDELLKCSQICTKWYKISKNELLWKLLVNKYYDDMKTIVGKNNMDKFMKCFSVKIVMNKFNINTIDIDKINIYSIRDIFISKFTKTLFV